MEVVSKIQELAETRANLEQQLDDVDHQVEELLDHVKNPDAQLTFTSVNPMHSVESWRLRSREYRKWVVRKIDKQTGRLLDTASPAFSFVSKQPLEPHQELELEITEDTPFRLRYTPEGSDPIETDISQIEQILGPHMNMAQFGDLQNQTTSEDSEVRSGKTLHGVELIPGDRIITRKSLNGQVTQMDFTMRMQEPTGEVIDTTVHPGAHYWEEGLQRIRDQMLGGRPAQFIPHSLNLYKPGDHFRTHVDTPRHSHARMVGTLVLYLKSSGYSDDNEDGCLEIDGTKILVDTFSDHLRGVFFYGDMPHKVNKLQRGTRVTLTFDVVLEPSEVIPRKLSDVRSRILLKNPGRTLVFFLQNQYTLEALQTKVMKCPEDQRLLEEIISLKIPFRLVPVMVSANQTRSITYKKARSSTIDFNNDPVRLSKKGKVKDVYTDGSAEHVFLIDPVVDNPILVDPYRSPVEIYTDVATVENNGTIYAGNSWESGIEMVCERFYTSAAIIVEN